jgi:GT2 family glycosyltransferase
VRLVDVVVADNHSRDKSVAIAEQADDIPVRVIQLGRNAGYAAAVNAGIATIDPAGVDAVFVINPDCRLRPTTLARLAYALRVRGCGITVPRMINVDGSLQPSLRREPSVRRALGESLLGKRAARFSMFAELLTAEREYTQPRRVAWATGAAMLISVDAVRDIGPWDESFLLYSEETEYALRAADHGWALWYEPTAEIVHIGGESGTNPMLASLLTVNRVTLFRRRHNLLHAGAYFAAVGLGEGLRALAGRRTAKAAVTALLRPSRRVRELPQ